jgi:uncharacterized lipoprotein YmbA
MWFALAWLVSVGVGCTSAPIRYYTLIPPPDMPSLAPQATLAIDVRVVHIPPELNRPELTVRTGPTETTLLDNEQWADFASRIHISLRGRGRFPLQPALS